MDSDTLLRSYNKSNTNHTLQADMSEFLWVRRVDVC